jgi:hypothetical protein
MITRISRSVWSAAHSAAVFTWPYLAGTQKIDRHSSDEQLINLSAVGTNTDVVLIL